MFIGGVATQEDGVTTVVTRGGPSSVRQNGEDRLDRVTY